MKSKSGGRLKMWGQTESRWRSSKYAERNPKTGPGIDGTSQHLPNTELLFVTPQMPQVPLLRFRTAPPCNRSITDIFGRVRNQLGKFSNGKWTLYSPPKMGLISFHKWRRIQGLTLTRIDRVLFRAWFCKFCSKVCAKISPRKIWIENITHSENMEENEERYVLVTRDLRELIMELCIPDRVLFRPFCTRADTQCVGVGVENKPSQSGQKLRKGVSSDLSHGDLYRKSQLDMKSTSVHTEKSVRTVVCVEYITFDIL